MAKTQNEDLSALRRRIEEGMKTLEANLKNVERLFEQRGGRPQAPLLKSEARASAKARAQAERI
jgi:hypothetical protein